MRDPLTAHARHLIDQLLIEQLLLSDFRSELRLTSLCVCKLHGELVDLVVRAHKLDLFGLQFQLSTERRLLHLHRCGWPHAHRRACVSIAQPLVIAVFDHLDGELEQRRDPPEKPA